MANDQMSYSDVILKEYIDFGKMGLILSRFGLGCLTFPTDKNEEEGS